MVTLREPYETLLGRWHDDPVLGRYLEGDEPDWLGLTLDDRLNACGSGQLAVLDLAAALKNVRSRCDGETQIRCMLAMQLVASGAIP